MGTDNTINTDGAPGHSRATAVIRRLRLLLPVVLLTAIAYLVWQDLQHTDIPRLRGQIRHVSTAALALPGALGMIAVAAMSVYDAVIARWLDLALPWRRLLRYSWIANSFNNLVGLSGLTGSGIRYLLLTHEGVTAANAARYSGLVMLATPLGLSVFLLGMLPAAPAILARLPTSGDLAFAAIALFALYTPLFWFLAGSDKLRRGALRELPQAPTGVRLALLGGSVLEWLLAAATLWVCLSASGCSINPALLLSAFSLAAALGIASLLPGGLGVLDGALLLFLAPVAGRPELIGGILLFRLVYYVLPWLLGVYLGAGLLTIGNQTLMARLAERVERHPLFGVLKLPVAWLASLGVRAMAWLTFLAGTILLLSAASPSLVARAAFLRHHLPAVAIEGSHLLSVATGVLLVGLARGIAGQVRSAYRLTQFLLVAGAVLCVLKGIDYEEATFLLAVALLLRGRRQSFFRDSYALLSRRNLYWLLAFAGALGLFAIIGASLSGSTPLTRALSRSGYTMIHEARFLQSLLVVAVTVLGYLGFSLYRMPSPGLRLPDREELGRAGRFFTEQACTSFSHLAMMGDKYLFDAAEGRALIQFGAIRDVFVALGDPACEPSYQEPAISEFRDFADRHDRTPVFYEVQEQRLHHYHDLGFALFKLGEQALVDLASFSLQGKRKADLRTALNRAEREGLQFDLLEGPVEPPLLQELQAVSDEWLAARNSAEKGFSLGRFTPEYLATAPIAVIRAGERIVAFGNLMTDYGHRRELSIDLMRHRSDVPPGTMDFLFVRLIQYAREQGYQYFNLGIAPLAGVGETPWSRPAERLAGLAYQYGDRLYNYKGLRRYKDKFDPVWQGVYLAYPYGSSVQILLFDIAALIAGGYLRLLIRS